MQAAQAARESARAQLQALQIAGEQRQASAAKERGDLEVCSLVLLQMCRVI